MAAIEKKKMNIHVPQRTYDAMRSVMDAHGMSFTEFANRSLAASIEQYKRTGALPPKDSI